LLGLLTSPVSRSASEKVGLDRDSVRRAAVKGAGRRGVDPQELGVLHLGDHAAGSGDALGDIGGTPHRSGVEARRRLQLGQERLAGESVISAALDDRVDGVLEQQRLDPCLRAKPVDLVRANRLHVSRKRRVVLGHA